MAVYAIKKQTYFVENQVLISVVTVSYNAVATIEQTILSVINQTYPNIEYIIIDGGSTDGTVDIIKKYEDKIAYWVSEPDKGIYDAMNKGIARANGSFIGIINSDDWYVNDTISVIANLIIKNPDVDVFCGDMFVYYSPSKQKVQHSYYNKIKSKMSINHPTCFIRSDIYLRKSFSLDYKLASDYDFLLWCYQSGYRFYNVDKPLANFTVGGISYKSNNKGTFEAFRIWKEQLGIFYAVPYFLRDILKRYISCCVNKFFGIIRFSK